MRPKTIQPSPTQRVVGFWTTSTRNEAPVAMPPAIAKSGHVDAADADVRVRAEHDLRLVPVEHPEPDERGMRDGERERRSERVERADEVHVAREEQEDRRDPREHDERQPRRLEARMERAQALRQLAVARHRVRDAGRADDARVRRDEEDRGREHADVDLRDVERQPLQPEVLDDAEDRVVRVPALLRREREAASSARRRSPPPAAPTAPRAEG